MGGLLVLCAAFITINGSKTAMPKQEKWQWVAPGKQTPPLSLPATSIQKTPSKTIPRPMEKPVQQRQVVTVNQLDTTIKGTKKDTTAEGRGPPIWAIANLSLDKLIEMREHGVTADFVLSFRKMGYSGITPDQAIELRDHGVTVEYIREFPKLGLQGYFAPQSGAITGSWRDGWSLSTAWWVWATSPSRWMRPPN